MKLEVKYGELTDVINLLDKLKLKGIQSIHRTRLSRKLTEELQRVGEEQKEIYKQYFELDEKGEPIVSEKTLKDKEEYTKTMSDFLNEKVIIDTEDSQVMLKSVRSVLEESEVEWNMREAYIYENLYTQLCEGDEKEDKQ